MAFLFLLSFTCIFVPALLGLSSASFQISIRSQNEAFWHASCLYVPECEATNVSSDADDQGMYCDLTLAYTPCTDPHSAGSTRRGNCQLSLIATCCIQGSKQERIYTVDVENVPAIDTLNFTFATTKGPSDKLGMKEDVSKACGHITWMGDLQNMWQRTVLRCNNNGSQPFSELYDYSYNCTPTGGKVCENNNTTNNTSCRGHTVSTSTTASSVFAGLFLLVLAVMIAVLVQRKCSKSSKCQVPGGTTMSCARTVLGTMVITSYVIMMALSLSL